MLIGRFSVNFIPVDDILIHNMGEIKKGVFEYEIMNPEKPGERLVEKTVTHNRNKGYRPLMIKVLQLLIKEKIEEKILK